MLAVQQIAEALLYKCNLARTKFRYLRPSMGSKDGYTRPARQSKLPIIGVRMPIHFTKCTQLQQYGRSCQPGFARRQGEE